MGGGESRPHEPVLDTKFNYPRPISGPWSAWQQLTEELGVILFISWDQHFCRNYYVFILKRILPSSTPIAGARFQPSQTQHQNALRSVRLLTQLVGGVREGKRGGLFFLPRNAIESPIKPNGFGLRTGRWGTGGKIRSSSEGKHVRAHVRMGRSTSCKRPLYGGPFGPTKMRHLNLRA